MPANPKQQRLHFRLEAEDECVPEPEFDVEDNIHGQDQLPNSAPVTPEFAARSENLYLKLEREVQKLDPDVPETELSALRLCIEGRPSKVLAALEKFHTTQRSRTPLVVVDRMIGLAKLLVQLEQSSQQSVSRAWPNHSPTRDAGGSTTRTTIVYKQQEALLQSHVAAQPQMSRFRLLLGQQGDALQTSSNNPLTPRTASRISELVRRRHTAALQKCKPKFQPFFPSLDVYSAMCEQGALHPSILTEAVADKADAICYIQAIADYRRQQKTSGRR